MFSLSSYIGLSSDDAMEAYTSSEEYLAQRRKVSDLIAALKSTLSKDQELLLYQLLAAMDNSTADYVKNAFTAGVVHGIRVRDDFIV